MQADWLQATEEQQFRDIIGIGMDTRSIVAHNINERMQCNQHGGCAMMAMGRFFCWSCRDGRGSSRSGSMVLDESWFRRQEDSNSHGIPALGLQQLQLRRHDGLRATWRIFWSLRWLEVHQVNIFWAIDCPASSMENNGLRYHITGRLQLKHVHLHRADCKTLSAGRP